MCTDSIYCMSGHTATVGVDAKIVVCYAFCVVAVSGLVCVAGDFMMWPLLLWRRDEWRDVLLLAPQCFVDFLKGTLVCGLLLSLQWIEVIVVALWKVRLIIEMKQCLGISGRKVSTPL